MQTIELIQRYKALVAKPRARSEGLNRMRDWLAEQMETEIRARAAAALMRVEGRLAENAEGVQGSLERHTL